MEFDDLWAKAKLKLKQKNIRKLNRLIALDELDMRVKVKDSHSFLYIGEIEVEGVI